MIPNSLHVEARGSVAVITNGTPYELRLLGTSCHTDCELYKVTDRITLSLEKGKRGLVALSLCSPDKSVFTREIFEVNWVGGNLDKIFVNFKKPLSSELCYSNEITENGFNHCDTFQEVKTEYRIPWVFWGDTVQAGDELFVSKHVQTLEGVNYKIFNDGNVFCRRLVCEADENDLEAAHLVYKMEDLSFRKRMAKELVERRVEAVQTFRSINLKGVECNKRGETISCLRSETKDLMENLVSIKNILNGKGTWWGKLKKIRSVFSSSPRLKYLITLK